MSMFIIIQMYRKRRVKYYELCSSFFEILTFSALRVGLHLLKKTHTCFTLNILDAVYDIVRKHCTAIIQWQLQPPRIWP